MLLTSCWNAGWGSAGQAAVSQMGMCQSPLLLRTGWSSAAAELTSLLAISYSSTCFHRSVFPLEFSLAALSHRYFAPASWSVCIQAIDCLKNPLLPGRSQQHSSRSWQADDGLFSLNTDTHILNTAQNFQGFKVGFKVRRVEDWGD